MGNVPGGSSSLADFRALEPPPAAGTLPLRQSGGDLRGSSLIPAGRVIDALSRETHHRTQVLIDGLGDSVADGRHLLKGRRLLHVRYYQVTIVSSSMSGESTPIAGVKP